jgi:hypothetical protein
MSHASKLTLTPLPMAGSFFVGIVKSFKCLGTYYVYVYVSKTPAVRGA